MRKKRLIDTYRFQGFVPEQEVQEAVSDTNARIIQLKRRQKKQYVLFAAERINPFTTANTEKHETCPVANCVFIWESRFAGCPVRCATW